MRAGLGLQADCGNGTRPAFSQLWHGGHLYRRLDGLVSTAEAASEPGSDGGSCAIMTAGVMQSFGGGE